MSRKLLTQPSALTLCLLFGILITQVLHPQPRIRALAATSVADYAIAYVGPSRDSQQIRLINPDGSEDRPLWQVPPNTNRLNGIGELSWRSDASELAFDSGHDWQRSMNLRDIYSITPHGTGFRRLTRPPAASDASAYPIGTVTFWLDSYAQGDVQLYLEGADEPISFVAKMGYSYQITQTLADLGENVRQSIRLYDPYQLTDNWCNYNEVAWVDVVAGQTTDAGRINFGITDDHTCPQTIRPAWMYNNDELLYLFAEPTTISFQEENNLWQISSDAPPTEIGTRLLDYGQYLLEGRLFLVTPGRSAATADQLLAGVREDIGTSIFRAPIADPGQREFIDLGSCELTCEVAGLAWLPDGSGFVFSRFETYIGISGIEEGSVIYRYTFADQQMTALYQIPDRAIGRLDVSPDGSQIVFEQSDQFDETTENFWLEPLLLCPCQLWIVNSDGTNAHLFVDDGRAPVWSPAPLPNAPPPPTATPTVTPMPPVDPGQADVKMYLPLVQK
jgi:hypothetical protein